MKEWLPIAISIAAVSVSLISATIALIAFRRSYRNAVIQMTHSLHSKLFEDLEDYKLLYRSDERDQKYYFDARSRGVEGNFVGSSEEAQIDNFLERLNFICMWFLPSKARTSLAPEVRHFAVTSSAGSTRQTANLEYLRVDDVGQGPKIGSIYERTAKLAMMGAILPKLGHPYVSTHFRIFAAVAQLVRAPDCGSGGRWFESTQLYHPYLGRRA
jgi:hypothetical protein